MMPFPEPLTSIFLVAFGLSLGSFMNVCIYRLPVGESISYPGSRCPGCKSAIRWYQNIPVLSWVALGAKCAKCGTKISARYPFIEALSGGIVLAMWMLFGPTPEFLIAAPFTLALVVLFFTDLDHQILPDAVTLVGTGVGLAVAWFNPFLSGVGWHRVWMSMAGAALGAGVLWGVGAIYGKLRGVEAMGMGDVKMMGMVGAFAGPAGVLFTIFAGSVLGALFGLALVPLRGRSLRDTLPFGCFLAPAALAALLVGRQALEAYMRLVVPGP
jgi:leader peptidase (prepilin peptidase)/N-methyltransferase